MTENKIFLLDLPAFHMQIAKSRCLDDVNFETCCKLLDARDLTSIKQLCVNRHLSYRRSKRDMHWLSYSDEYDKESRAKLSQKFSVIA